MRRPVKRKGKLWQALEKFPVPASMETDSERAASLDLSKQAYYNMKVNNVMTLEVLGKICTRWRISIPDAWLLTFTALNLEGKDLVRITKNNGE